LTSKTGWQREFDDPIPLPNGKPLVTLRDAADYITSLPKKESGLPEWQAAIEALMLVARSGPTMMARIGVMKALNRHVERVFNPDRKDTHWGKRKLKGAYDRPRAGLSFGPPITQSDLRELPPLRCQRNTGTNDDNRERGAQTAGRDTIDAGADDRRYFVHSGSFL
jgi:hypothetical protein